jgi:alkyl sulfatase BDS1-like metallo-beta-lactamase superfamily hydrolase
MELADRLIVTDQYKTQASQIKIKALRYMADFTINAPTRNYYLLAARELEETLVLSS